MVTQDKNELSPEALQALAAVINALPDNEFTTLMETLGWHDKLEPTSVKQEVM